MLIREKDKQMIIDLAKKTLNQPLEVWAYGSRVTGKAHETSDLDMVLVTNEEQELKLTDLLQFKKALENSNIPILTQVLDWNRIPKSFHQNILNNYEVMVRIDGELKGLVNEG
jgi:predicted nucleotidyltransferase